jgi:LEA14-like dessication related protein
MKFFQATVAVVAFTLTGASVFGFDLPKPTAEITAFRLDAISLRDVTFAFELTVNNPYPVGLPVDGLTLDFLVEGTKVFSTKNQGKLDIPANSKKSSPFTVVLSYAGIASLVKNYVEKDWLKTDVQGKLTIALPKLAGLPPEVSFDYHLTQTIPALKPEVTLVGFSVAGPTQAQVADAVKASASKVDAQQAFGAFQSILAGKKPTVTIDPTDIDVPFTLSYTLAFENKAKAPLSFRSLGYTLAVNGENLVSGESSQVKQEGAKTLVTVVNTFRSKQLSSGLQAVFRAKKGQFRITGNAQLQVPPSVRKDAVPLAVDESGTFSF